MEAISRAFMGWLRPREVVSQRGAPPGKEASRFTSAKILVYRLIGLNAWAARRLDIYLSLRAYRKTFGRNPDLVHPSLFCEKVTARKLFERRPIFSLIADKLLARDLAAEKIGAQYLPKLLAVCERFEDIDFERLPDKFLIKPNHGTHWVLPVDDKAALDKTAARRLVNRWLKTNYYVNSREIFYKNVKPRIMVEEYLTEASGAPLRDYRFYVFDGVAKFVTVQWPGPMAGQRTVARYTRSGDRLPDPEALPVAANRGEYIPPSPATDFALPANIEEMFALADRLGQGFDFIRVDLYNPGGRILFGELTTLPVGGVRQFNPPILDRLIGQAWRLNLGAASSGIAEETQSRITAARNAAKISIYRLIGLNAPATRRLDMYLSLRAYRRTFGRNPDLARPSLFSEKVTARKLFDRRPLMSQLADKLFAREFAATRIGVTCLPRLLMVCERFEEIDFGWLPDKFVIKANHGTHWVLLVDDKAALDRAAARKTVNRWMKTNYYVNSREYFYKGVQPRIMIEEFLEEPSGAPVIEFRFFVYDGAVKFLTVHQSNSLGGPRSNTRFNRALEKIPSAEPPEAVPELKMPPNIEDMFDLASRLGQGFDFIRVDLYAPGGRIVFGELTTLPMGGVRKMKPPGSDERFGEPWHLNLAEIRSSAS